MITIDKLTTFAKWSGDIDAWIRMGDTKTMSDSEWGLVGSLIQDWSIIKKGLASTDYTSAFEKKLSENLDSLETIEYFKSLRTY